MALQDTKTVEAPRVLITRPEGQHLELARQCRTLGFQVQLLPCVQIVPREIDPVCLQSTLSTRSIALFTSTNAVNSIHQYLPFPWQGVDVHAIGQATAIALNAHGQSVALTPASPYNSEAYLAQISREMPGKMLIVKGAGGRGLIQKCLRELGWQVDTLDTYERVVPQLPLDAISVIFTQTPPDVITVSSNEILENLWQLCAAYRDSLVERQLVCNSERCARLARRLGFKLPPMVAVPAGDAGQVVCLEQWMRSVHAR